jgi:hypothetical protein
MIEYTVPCVLAVLLLFMFVWRERKYYNPPRMMSINSADVTEILQLRSRKWNKFQPVKLVPFQFQPNKTLQLRAGLTFTPYTDALPCTAHCNFCSETLERSSMNGMTTPYDLPKRRAPLNQENYFSALQCVFDDFTKIPFTLGLSLSGLEATADPKWLVSLCQLLSMPQYTKVFDEKVIYSNGSGLVDENLIDVLHQTGFYRIELSRQHYDEQINQKIMRFNSKIAIRKNEIYAQVVRDLRNRSSIYVKNCCILTKLGISTVEDVERYAIWAKELGVQSCVFRELCQISIGPDSFVENRTSSWIEENRVSMDSIANKIVCASESGACVVREGWKYIKSSVGYYYFNEHYLFAGIEVIIEVSSYKALQNALETHTEVVDKMVFHSCGNLNSGWDPYNNILKSYTIDPLAW